MYKLYIWSSVHNIASIPVSVHKTVLQNYLVICYSIEYENVGEKWYCVVSKNVTAFTAKGIFSVCGMLDLQAALWRMKFEF
jgi:hypothetical protein